MNDKNGAIASFMSDVSKHPGTEFIKDAFTLMGLQTSANREAFKKFMEGFNV